MVSIGFYEKLKQRSEIKEPEFTYFIVRWVKWRSDQNIYWWRKNKKPATNWSGIEMRKKAITTMRPLPVEHLNNYNPHICVKIFIYSRQHTSKSGLIKFKQLIMFVNKVLRRRSKSTTASTTITPTQMHNGKCKYLQQQTLVALYLSIWTSICFVYTRQMWM